MARPSAASVDRTTRWRRVVPHCTATAGRSAGTPPRMSASATLSQWAAPMSTTTVGTRAIFAAELAALEAPATGTA